MAAAISQVKAGRQFCASSISAPKIGFNSPPIAFLKVEKQQSFLQRGRVVLRCGKGGSVPEPEKVLMEKGLLDMEEELIGMGKLNEKCKEIVGLVELLECLEREAIMGEDEGREPTDYNRRALIFDKSSRVFQALKQTDSA
ncbi:hypothetical protein CDL12_02437 [Handroanthus impetiginosus]|uniref:Uncharacterized protein n=1 Tax=Handroanthus impetiginosus TaxID=429701 RepID=A0A2G9I4Y7_9LAMI|nr:hypothetical protein CDL12_02437 [Handroanthus impetiginosus]